MKKIKYDNLGVFRGLVNKESNNKYSLRQKHDYFFEKPICYSFIIFAMVRVWGFLSRSDFFQYLIKILDEKIHFIQLQEFFNNFLKHFELWFDFSKLEFLAEFNWVLPYFFFALFLGLLHSLVFAQRLKFKNVLKMGGYLTLFQVVFVVFSETVINSTSFLPKAFPLGLYASVLLVPVSFFSFLIGSEIIMLFRKDLKKC